MKKSVRIEASGADLEGRMHTLSYKRAAIVTHPHPLYGGSMDNVVVRTVADAYASQGWSTLRFNFRGVGGSTGRYEEGIGEQKDIQGAVDHLTGMGFEQIDLAGYSFGAWVLAGWSRAEATHPYRVTMVSPPVAFVDFDCQRAIPGLHHVITGARDEIAPAETIEEAVIKWRPTARLSILKEADHFFQGHLDSLRDIIGRAI